MESVWIVVLATIVTQLALLFPLTLMGTQLYLRLYSLKKANLPMGNCKLDIFSLTPSMHTKHGMSIHELLRIHNQNYVSVNLPI